MRKCFVSVLLALTMFAVVTAQEAKMYGVTPNGIIFIHKSYVDKTEGSKPYAMWDPSWTKNHKMVLKGNYWVYETGKKLSSSFPFTWCVWIGGDKYLPHALFNDNVEVSGFDINDTQPNGQGTGKNFLTTPCELPSELAAELGKK
jgi:hypothetical protein